MLSASALSASPASLPDGPPTLIVSTVYNPDVYPAINRQNTTINVDANGGMIIGTSNNGPNHRFPRKSYRVITCANGNANNVVTPVTITLPIVRPEKK